MGDSGWGGNVGHRVEERGRMNGGRARSGRRRTGERSRHGRGRRRVEGRRGGMRAPNLRAAVGDEVDNGRRPGRQRRLPLVSLAQAEKPCVLSFYTESDQLWKIHVDGTHCGEHHWHKEALRRGLPSLGLRRAIKQLLGGCKFCTAFSPIHNRRKPDIQRRISEKPLDKVYMDFKGPFPPELCGADGYAYAAVAVDEYSGHVWSQPCTSPSTDSAINLLRTMLEDGHTPSAIHSDNGTAFTSERWQSYLRMRSITHITSVPHAHRMGGKVERVIRSLQRKLFSKLYTTEVGQPWRRMWPIVVMSYNKDDRRGGFGTPAQMLTLKSPVRIVGESEETYGRRQLEYEALKTQWKMAMKKRWQESLAVWKKNHTKVPHLEVGTMVAVRNTDRASPLNWMFAYRVKSRVGSIYTVEDKQGRTVEGKYAYDDLKRITKVLWDLS